MEIVRPNKTRIAMLRALIVLLCIVLAPVALLWWLFVPPMDLFPRKLD